MFGSPIPRRLLRTAVVSAGLALAVAVLSPSAAVANKGGTDRPIKDDETGTSVLNLLTGAFVADTTGVESHLGRVASHQEGVVTTTGPTTFTVTGSEIKVAANGDELFETFSGSGTLDAAGVATGPVVVTYTGGTGRFVTASGSATGQFSQVPISTAGTTATFATSVSLSGTISY